MGTDYERFPGTLAEAIPEFVPNVEDASDQEGQILQFIVAGQFASL